MKMPFSLLVFALLLFSFRNPISRNNYQSCSPGDTTIHHVLDGKTSEWPVQKFETDVSFEIKYAVDNDQQDLYVALIIPNSRTQMRIMRQGMQLYIDTKGKKKEGKGIEFPVKGPHGRK